MRMYNTSALLEDNSFLLGQLLAAGFYCHYRKNIYGLVLHATEQKGHHVAAAE